MTLVRQVLRDVRRELGWIVLYAALMSCAAYALVLMGTNASIVAEQAGASALFVAADARVVTTVEVPASPEAPAQRPGGPDALLAVLDEMLVEDGPAGSIVRVPGALGYELVCVFTGRYADLTGYARDRSRDVSLAVSRDLAARAPETIELAGRTYPLDVVGEDMSIPYPSYAEGPDLVGVNYRNTLFVFCPDYRLACELVPEVRSTDPWSGPLGGLVLFGPTDEDVVRLRSAALESAGLYLRVSTMDEATALSSDFSDARVQRVVTAFYVAAAAILAAVLVTSLYGSLARRAGELATHHLFGAPLSLLYVRMALFALVYQAAPACVAVWACLSMGRGGATTAAVLVVVAVVAEALLVALLAWRRLASVVAGGTKGE